ncbi:hypothetical protein KKG46_00055 [Patescibacteria group bacterium]|nr:hypothetical protein [Patescibacteria group bacterium]
MSGKALKALDLLTQFELYEIGNLPRFAKCLEVETITFITFACLGTKKGKEQLKLSVDETLFFKNYRKTASKLFQILAENGVGTNLLVVLPDLEPRRTWGWSVPQEELTGYCQMMAEDASPSLPNDWKIAVWSELESATDAVAGYDDALDWAIKKAHPIIVSEETLFFKMLAKRHPDILTKNKPKDMAVRQIAAYAHEGRVLEELYPDAILIQADAPVSRKDKMFQPLRKTHLPIFHPFG